MLKEHETQDHTEETDFDAKDEPRAAADLTEDEDAAENHSAQAEDSVEVALKTALDERDRALAEKAALFDRFQRAQAEFDNWRKRLVREKQETQEYAAMSTIESLLPIVDDLERAMAAPGLDPDVKKGLELIHQRIIEVFTRAGMKPVAESGEFDPHVHHAVDRAPAETDEQDQSILEVYQRGYHFKDRLIRPAMVKVAVKE